MIPLELTTKPFEGVVYRKFKSITMDDVMLQIDSLVMGHKVNFVVPPLHLILCRVG